LAFRAKKKSKNSKNLFEISDTVISFRQIEKVERSTAHPNGENGVEIVGTNKIVHWMPFLFIPAASEHVAVYETITTVWRRH